MKLRLILGFLSVLAAASILALAGCRDKLVGPPNNPTTSNDTIAHWIFFGNTNDVSGNGHNGTIIGTTAYGPDRFGNPDKAIVLDGNTVVSVAEKTDINFTSNDSYTISAWVQLKDNLNSAIIVNGPATEPPVGYQLLASDGEIIVDINDSLNRNKDQRFETIDLLRGDTSTGPGPWHLVTLAVVAHTSVSVYLDSALLGVDTNVAAMAPELGNTGPLLMGSENHQGASSLDDILILHHAVTLADVQARFHEGGWYAGYGATGTTSDTTSAQLAKGTTIPVPVVYALCFPDAKDGYACGIYASMAATHDSGATWTKLNTGIQDDLFGVSFAGPSMGLAVGGNAIPGGVIIRTTDGGKSWGQSSSNPWWIHPANSHVLRDVKYLYDPTMSMLPATAIAVGEDSSNNGMILTSRDSGMTWTLVKSTPFPLYSIASSNSKYGYAIVVGDNGQVFITTDLGASWSDNSVGTANLRTVSLDPSTGIANDAVAISTDNSTFWSTDMGNTWVEHPAAGAAQLITVYEAGGGEAWGENQTGPIFQTLNHGATWVNQTQLLSVTNGPWWNCIGARDLHHIAFVAQGGDIYWLTR